MYQVDAKYPFASKVNAELLHYEGMSLDALYNEDLQGILGDSIVSNADGSPTGKVIPGTMTKYEDATSVQYYVAEFYQESGQEFPANLAAILLECAGPAESWNYPYCENGWGLRNTTPNSNLKIASVIKRSDATVVVGFLQS